MTTNNPFSPFQRKLFEYVSSGAPCVLIQTPEEDRCLAEILALMVAMPGGKNQLFKWTATTGTRKEFPPPPEGTVPVELVKPGPGSLPEAAKWRPPFHGSTRGPMGVTLYVFCDTHTWPIKESPTLNRAIRDLVDDAGSMHYTVLLIGPRVDVPDTFEKKTVVLPFDLPNEDVLAGAVKQMERNLRDENHIDVPSYDLQMVSRSLAGLTVAEANNVLALSASLHNGAFHVPRLHEEKVRAVRRTGTLEILENVPIEQIGGLDKLKAWLRKRTRAFTNEARGYGLPMPRGMLAIGPPGTGKSLIAKAVGSILGVPVLRMDIGAMFGSLVGESERRMRDAIKMCESVAPCVLNVDEIDKGFAGNTAGEASGDSGTSRRVLGNFLTWLQEKTTYVYVVATANSVLGLPPELLRKGRFDELWFIDLPTPAEREVIFAIHLEKRGRDPDHFDLETLATATHGFVGSEIEAVVADALYEAFDQDREVTTMDIQAAIAATKPLSETMGHAITAAREWAHGRARVASSIESAVGGRRARQVLSGKLN